MRPQMLLGSHHVEYQIHENVIGLDRSKILTNLRHEQQPLIVNPILVDIDEFTMRAAQWSAIEKHLKEYHTK